MRINKGIFTAVALTIAVIIGYPSYNYFAHNEPLTTEQIVSKNIDGVVVIHNYIKGKEKGNEGQPAGLASGTGFFVDDNLIVTNNHVIDDSLMLEVKGYDSNRFFPAKVINTDADTDVAILKIVDWDQYKKENKFKILKFGKSRDARLGEKITTIGHPVGYEYSVSDGNITGLEREFVDGDGNKVSALAMPFYIQIDANITNGNSGGPLFDDHGNVIGINDAILPVAGGKLAFSIPSDLVTKVISDFVNLKKVTWSRIGIEFAQMGKARYVIINDVVVNTPAFKAGLTKLDAITTIKTKYTGDKGRIVKSSGDIISEIQLLDPGDSVEFSILRAGKPLNVKMQTVGLDA
jgi:serine protease Do